MMPTFQFCHLIIIIYVIFKNVLIMLYTSDKPNHVFCHYKFSTMIIIAPFLRFYLYLLLQIFSFYYMYYSMFFNLFIKLRNRIIDSYLILGRVASFAKFREMQKMFLRKNFRENECKLSRKWF